MKIAIVDFTFAKTHKRFNLANYEVLSRFAELYIVNTGHYYDSLDKYANVHLFNTDIANKNKKNNVFATSMDILDNMRINGKMFKKYRKVKFDAVLVMGYGILTFPFYWFFMPWNVPVYLFQHQQINYLSNWLRRNVFSLYKNKVYHIVLEEILVDFVKNTIKAKNVNIVHWISYIQRKGEMVQKEKFISGISSNHDEAVIKEIIENQKKKHFLDKYNIKMYLRSKKYNYKDEFLEVNYRYLTDQEYDKLYKKTTAVLAAVPRTWVNRLSGPVLDAISNGKPVIGTPVPCLQYYHKVAPSMFKIFSSELELEKILEEDNWNINKEELEKLQKKYVPDAIEKEYRKIFRRYLRK